MLGLNAYFLSFSLRIISIHFAWHFHPFYSAPNAVNDPRFTKDFRRMAHPVCNRS